MGHLGMHLIPDSMRRSENAVGQRICEPSNRRIQLNSNSLGSVGHIVLDGDVRRTLLDGYDINSP